MKPIELEGVSIDWLHPSYAINRHISHGTIPKRPRQERLEAALARLCSMVAWTASSSEPDQEISAVIWPPFGLIRPDESLLRSGMDFR